MRESRSFDRINGTSLYFYNQSNIIFQQTNASKQNPQKIRMSIAVLCGVLQFNSNSLLWTKAVTIVS